MSSSLSYEELADRLAKHVRAVETAKDKRSANRAALLVKSTVAKMKMLTGQYRPGITQDTGSFEHEDRLEKDPYWTDPEAQFPSNFDRWDAEERILEMIGSALVGEDPIRVSAIGDDFQELDEDEEEEIENTYDHTYQVEADTRLGTIMGGGTSWAAATASLLSSYEEIRERARFVIRAMEQKEAFEFIALVHRHHDPPPGDKFRLGAYTKVNGVETLIGVVVVGRPPSRHTQNQGGYWEVTRMAVLPGAQSVNSALYSAAWKEAKRLGCKRMLTYVLCSEPATTLRAAGWRLVSDHCGGGSWDRESRRRLDKHPQETKQRWEIGDPYDDLLLLEIPLEDLKDPAPNLLMTVGAFVPLTKKGKTKLELVGVASAFQGPASTAKVQVTTLEGKARLIDIDLYRDIAKRARATGAQRLITEVPCGQADGIGRAGGWRKAGECGDNGMQAWESGAKGTA